MFLQAFTLLSLLPCLVKTKDDNKAVDRFYETPWEGFKRTRQEKFGKDPDWVTRQKSLEQIWNNTPRPVEVWWQFQLGFANGEIDGDYKWGDVQYDQKVDPFSVTNTYEVPYNVEHQVCIRLRQGVKMETICDIIRWCTLPSYISHEEETHSKKLKVTKILFSKARYWPTDRPWIPYDAMNILSREEKTIIAKKKLKKVDIALEQGMVSARPGLAVPQRTLSALQPHASCLEHHIVVLFPLTSFMLTTIGLKKLRSFQKPAPELQVILLPTSDSLKG